MDNSKKRFSLQFDISDPVQKFAYSILSSQGRRKADFIARAIKYYAETSPDIVQTNEIYDKDFVKTIILSVLEEVQPNQAREMKVISPIQSEPIPQPVVNKPIQPPPAKQNPVSSVQSVQSKKEEESNDDSLDMLLSGLDMFG